MSVLTRRSRGSSTANASESDSYVAVQTFSMRDGGDLVTFTAGRDWVHWGGHAAIRQYPERFAREGSAKANAAVVAAGKTGNRSASRSTATAPRTSTTGTAKRGDGRPAYYVGEWPPPAKIELRERVGSETVELWPAARNAIETEARASRDGTETGGLIFGAVPWSFKPLCAERAIGPGPNAQRAVDSLTWDEEYDAAEVAGRRALSQGRTAALGHYHTHPEHGETTPSDTDMRTWAGLLVEMERESGGSRFVGIIVTPGPEADDWSRWSHPALTAYVVTRARKFADAVFVCERATIAE